MKNSLNYQYHILNHSIHSASNVEPIPCVVITHEQNTQRFLCKTNQQTYSSTGVYDSAILVDINSLTENV